MDEESWRRNHGGGIKEEESRKRNPGLEALERHLEVSGKSLGGLWERSGRHLEASGRLMEALLGLLGSRGVLEGKHSKTIVFYRCK